MGLCTNRVLMASRCLHCSTPRRERSDPAPLGSASNDMRKERAACLLTAVGTSRRLEVGQSMSTLPRVFQTSTCFTIREPVRGVAEHSSVMSMVFVSTYFRRRGDWLKTRPGTSQAGLTFEKTIRPTVL